MSETAMPQVDPKILAPTKGTIVAYMQLEDAAAASAFYQKAFGATEHAQRTADYAAELKRSRKARPSDEIVMPGERGHQKKKTYACDGIPLLVSVWENTKKIGQDLGVQAPQLG